MEFACYPDRMKRIARGVALLLILALNVVLWQNCSQAPQLTGTSSPTTRAESGGDGRPYEGKTYVDRSSTCSQAGEVFARIEYKNASLAVLTRDNCADLTTAVNLGAADFSVDQTKNVLYYRSRVFQAEEKQGPQIVRANCDMSSFNVADKSTDNRLEYMYCVALGRGSDGGGLAAWKSEVANGMTYPQILTASVNSSEFDSTYHTTTLSHANYVILMYRLALNRDPSSAELFAATDRLAARTVTRVDYTLEVFSSNEFGALHTIFF